MAVARSILERPAQFQWDADSAPCKSSNCRPTAIAMIAGYYKDTHISPTQMRLRMTASSTCGGTFPSQGVRGLEVSGVPATWAWKSPAAVKALLNANIPVDLSVDYGLIPNNPAYQTDYGFNGNHSVVGCKVVTRKDHTGKLVPGILVRDPDHGSASRPERPASTFWPDWVWVPAFVALSSSKTTGLVVYPKAAKVLPPLYPFSAAPYVRTVQVTTKDGLNVRTSPRAGATLVKTLPFGAKVKTALLTTKGGSYKVGTTTRNDWYGLKQPDGKYLWIARGFTKVV